MQNKEVKRLIIIQFLILLIFIGVNLTLNNIIYGQYKKDIINNNAYIISNIINNHPELETEIINNIISNDGDYINGKAVMEKYGLSIDDNMQYLVNIKNVKEKIYFYNMIFLGLLFVLISTVYIIFIQRQYKKINKINKYINNILNGDYSLDIRDHEEGNISNLKNDIYKMTVRLKEQNELSIKDKKYLEEVLSDISHQIKTPLTSMYVINDLLAKEGIEPKQRKDFLIKNHNQLERMKWLVTSLLKMSRLESGTINLKQEEVVVQSLINSALEPLLIPIELKKQKVDITGDEYLKILVDYEWTLESLVNILKNAHEHTDNGGKISISYEANPIYTQITISDNGEGISSDDINHVFERFYKSKNNNKDSIGIGLNMTKKIIDMQNGEISVESENNNGTTFIVKFYKVTKM